MIVRDSMILDASGLSITRDGYLSGLAKVSRAGNVQMYMGHELGLTGDEANRAVGVYRDPDVIFKPDSMMSLAGRPVTRGHPPFGVDASNWKDLVVGNMGGKVVRDGEHVVAGMAIMDAAAAKEVLDGARSLSAGYTVKIDRDSGVASDGTPYEFKQSGELRFNHVAYLPDNNPRAGNTRIGDSAFSWGAGPLTVSDNKGGHMADLRKITVDGVPVETTDAGAAVIEKLQRQLADADAYKSKSDKDKDEMEADMAKKDAAITKLEAEALDDAAIDARVQARADLLTKARAVVADLKTAGLSDAAIRRAAVVAKLGDAAVEGKSDAYVDARFDILTEDAGTEKPDPIKDAKIKPVVTNDLATVYAARDAALTNAWKV